MTPALLVSMLWSVSAGAVVGGPASAPAPATQNDVDAELEGPPRPPAPDDDDADDDDPTVGRWGIGIVPKFTLNSDDGVGFGLRGTVYWYRWNQQPYKTAISFQAWVTTRLVQHHYLRVDAIDAFNLPIRILAEVGYFQSRSQNFCGWDGDCDPERRERALLWEGLNQAARDRIRPTYYQVRFIRPYALTNLRWRLAQVFGAAVSLFGGWRGFYYQPGDWLDDDRNGRPDLEPYPYSYYKSVFPQGEPGFASVAQVGLMVDSRDEEPAPRKGIWAEASARMAHPWMLSSWTYSGFNTTVRTYVPLVRAKWLVFASRYVGDLVLGDPPLQEMVRVGGSTDYIAYGGAQMGRGIRIQRYPGRVKLMMQHELRYEFPSFTIFDQELRFGLAGFVDAGSIGYALTDYRNNPLLLRLGWGISLRVAFNRNFVMRLDIAMSRDEGYAPVVYSGPNHPF